MSVSPPKGGALSDIQHDTREGTQGRARLVEGHLKGSHEALWRGANEHHQQGAPVGSHHSQVSSASRAARVSAPHVPPAPPPNPPTLRSSPPPPGLFTPSLCAAPL